MCGIGHANISAGSPDILDEKLLTELVGELLRDDTRDNIRDATSGERHNYFNRMIGVTLRMQARH
jgi:hypothetical protein